MKPVDIYDPEAQAWSQGAKPPIELHHFQAVSHEDAIYIIGAMTGGWPFETPVERVIAYYPQRDAFVYLHDIPESRRRGGAGATIHNDKIYLVGGIVNGHWDGTVAWTDTYDIATGAWTVLPDAPHRRDHFQAVTIENKLYAFGGRRSLQREGKGFDLTTAYGDIFDITTGSWDPVTGAHKIPTPRAGNMAIAWDAGVLIGGGESGSQVDAHREVEYFDPASQVWAIWPAIARGRHGTGFAIIDGFLYTASGSGNRGGEPELFSLERLKLPEPRPRQIQASHARPVYKQWHTVEFDFQGPETSESAPQNPFTDYLLQVEFTHQDDKTSIRGFYAADGEAADSSAASGNIWRVRFSPDKVGEWSYRANMISGRDVAYGSSEGVGKAIPLAQATGRFLVEPSDASAVDFRSLGKLEARQGHFYVAGQERPWLKGGTNSPENLLGYVNFDGTYRIGENARDGEATAGSQLHSYPSHAADWKLGDPDWQAGKGKSLIGAMNYLSSAGLNSAYFLTMNIGGDGKDVWPYASPDDVTRFDVSKLAQWERVFAHMQARGIMLHIVLQETENELMLDGGDTDRERQLYLQEMIARFGHHPGLVWNLGEENGPVHWMPTGQDTAQRIAMASFIRENDPYRHPILLHTHSEASDKDEILTPLLGFEDIDGLSFQVGDRETIFAEVAKWRARSAKAGKPWLITMDEVGPWQVGARADKDDPAHDTARRHALWGALLGGASGVEWYFGAHQDGNDLTTEDFRSRDALWRQTSLARQFFEAHVPYVNMSLCKPGIVATDDTYCAQHRDDLFLIYVPAGVALSFTGLTPENMAVSWLDPIKGGDLVAQDGQDALLPPDPQEDWVALITSRKMEADQGREK